MEDTNVRERIEQLVAEEHELLERHGDGTGLGDDEHRRLERVGVELDQCWDLLRQRRALREHGLDPDAAQVRREETVERYLQ